MARCKTAWGPPFVPALLAALCAAGAVDPARAAETSRSFEVYGIAQADAIVDSKRVDPLWEDTFRPSKIGVDGQYGTDGQ